VQMDEDCYSLSYLIAVVHEIVNGDEGLVDDHPAGTLRALNQQVGHVWYRDVCIVSTMYQI